MENQLEEFKHEKVRLTWKILCLQIGEWFGGE